jgi:hypothetical protein
MTLERGYLSTGKDRQHPVDGQPYGEDSVAVPQVWSGFNTLTWYASVNLPRAPLPIYPPIGWPTADGP